MNNNIVDNITKKDITNQNENVSNVKKDYAQFPY